VLSHSGEIDFFLAFKENIDQRVRVQDELRSSLAKLEEANRVKDRLFSIVAHDLKNPFSNIIGLSEMLHKRFDKFPTEKVRRFLGYIYQSSEQGFSLLENLLQWSRAQRGHISFSPRSIDLVATAQVSLEFLAPIAQSKGIALRNILPEQLQALADADMVQTILRNLGSNALKFTPEGGSVTFGARSEGQEVLVWVQDDGIGMEADQLEKLFRDDMHHSTPGLRNEKGTGLGLTLCREFVDKHGGRIWAESQPGKGTRMTFCLPQPTAGPA